MIVHSSSLFQYFLSIYYHPYCSWKFLNFCMLVCLLTFLQLIIIVVWWTRPLSIIVRKLSIHYTSLSAMFNLLCTAVQISILKSTSNQVANMKGKNRWFPLCKGSHHMVPPNRQFFTISKQRWMEHKGGHWCVHEESIVCTVVCQKAPLDVVR